jgi:hypothetical protein
MIDTKKYKEAFERAPYSFKELHLLWKENYMEKNCRDEDDKLKRFVLWSTTSETQRRKSGD